VPEFARTYFEADSRPPAEWTAADYQRVCEGYEARSATYLLTGSSQSRLVQEAIAQGGGCGAIVISDTSPLATAVWSLYLSGATPPAVQEYADNERFDLYVVRA